MGYESLGFNPAPGDPARGDDMVLRLRAATTALGEMEQTLAGAGDDAWHGKSAEAFFGLVEEDLTPRVKEAHQSFDTATRALEKWLRDLDGFQSRARALELEAKAARDDLASASSAVDNQTDLEDDADTQAKDDHKTEAKELSTALSTKQGALDDILARARTLAGEASDSASTTTGALNTAMDVAPDEPGLLDRIGGALEDIGEFLGDVVEFVKDNWWDILHKIVHITATVLAIASIFCPALAPFALGFAIADVAMSGIDWARGVPGAKEAFLTGVIGLAGGAALGAVFKAATPAITNTLRGGPFSVVMAGGAGTVASPAVAAISINGGYRAAAGGYMVMRYNDAQGGADNIMNLLGGNTYYDNSLSSGWNKARNN